MRNPALPIESYGVAASLVAFVEDPGILNNMPMLCAMAINCLREYAKHDFTFAGAYPQFAPTSRWTPVQARPVLTNY